MGFASGPRLHPASKLVSLNCKKRVASVDVHSPPEELHTAVFVRPLPSRARLTALAFYLGIKEAGHSACPFLLPMHAAHPRQRHRNGI